MLNLPVLSGVVDLMVTPSCCAAMVVLLKVKVVVTKPWMPVFTRGTTEEHRLEVVLAGIPGLDDGLAGVEVEHEVGHLARRHIEVGLQLQAALLAAGRVQRDPSPPVGCTALATLEAPVPVLLASTRRICE